MTDLNQRMDALCDSLAEAQKGFNDAAELCAKAMQDLHERTERVEKWIKSVVDYQVTIKDRLERIEKWREKKEKTMEKPMLITNGQRK